MHSQEFAAHLAASSRNFSLAGEIDLLTGARLSFTGGQALSFMMSEGGNDGQLLGGAFSASCSLSLYDEGGHFTPYSLRGARVQVNLCAGEHQAPLAVFYVTGAVYHPESKQITLTGSDALGVAFETAFEDDFIYPLTLGEMAVQTAALAGYQLPADFPNHEILIAERPSWGNISLRQALSYMAGAAGCFAAMDRQDHLKFRRVWQDDFSAAIPPAQILSMEAGDAAFGPLTALSIQMKGAPKDTQPLMIKTGDEQPGSFNCLSIADHPLFAWQAAHTEKLAQGVFWALQGMYLAPFRLSWRGDPERRPGDRVKIVLPSGEEKTMLITRQSTAFLQGFSMQSDCAVRSPQGTAGRIFTASGSINAARLSGNINGALIQDGSIAASSLVAGSITSLQLAADAVTAEKIAAGSVQARHITAGAVNAEKIDAKAVQARHLSADALSAVDAHIVNAEIDWAQIQDLQAAIARIAGAEIQNAEIDFAKVKDLAADTAIITKGTSGELYISRLAVTEANMVSLSVGQLLVKGEDGGFYALTVDENGKVITEKNQVGNDDIGNLSINAGEKLIEGSVTAATLNVKDIFADSAIIRQMIAANISVDTLFAREATLSAINALDIRGNQYLKLSVDALREEMATAASDAGGQQLTISFERGNAIERDTPQITASARVWKNGEDVTDLIPEGAFSWQKESGNPEADTAWQEEHHGMKQITLTREEIGKSCMLRCLLDEENAYGAFAIENGELMYTVSDMGSADAFSLQNGSLWGDGKYILESGEISAPLYSRPMQAETPVFDHTVLQTSHITVQDERIDIASGGSIRIAAGGKLEMAASALKLTSTTTLEDELNNNANTAADAQSAANAAQETANSANAAAGNAQSAADKAQAAANNASNEALNAQNTANAANIAASNAQTTADNAMEEAKKTPSKVSNGALVLDENGIDMQGGTVRIRAGASFQVESGGTANVDAEDGHINLGEDFSVSDQGSLVAKEGSFASGLYVRGGEVNPGPKVIVSASEPEESGILWMKPSSVRNVSYSRETGPDRNTSWYDHSANASHAFILSAETADTMVSGTFLYTFRLPLYEIEKMRSNIRIRVTAQKASGGDQVIFPEYTLAEIWQWQQVIVEIQVESPVNLGATTEDINVQVSMSGVTSWGGLHLQKNDRLTLSMVNQTATDRVMPCEIYYKP